MKKFLIFLAGMIAGAFLLVIVIYLVGNSSDNNGITLFDEPGEVMEIQSYKVFQVINGGHALANTATLVDLGWFSGPVVLMYASGGDAHYYDDQILKAEKNQCYRQIGIYQYVTKNGEHKTVPIISLFDK